MAALTVVGTFVGLVPLAPAAHAAQPVPAQTRLVPDTPRTDVPRITTGEITDIAYIGDHVYIAGTFTSIKNNTATNTDTVAQPNLASYNMTTGLIDTSFRPVFGGGGVQEVEASPDGTKLFVVGTFSTVNGVAKRKVASISPTTGAPVAGFTANANLAATAVEATNSTVYIGGNFTTVNGVARLGLAAVNASTGAVVAGFKNDLSGGIGPNGELTVPALVLSHDESKLLVVHTGRQIAGQDRYGAGLISTSTNQLLPWRTRLWDENLQYVGGIQRAYAADIAPNDQYFVVTAGSGGDRPPISDTAMAFPMNGDDNVQPLWVSRLFDSVYSVAISEVAVYLGGHFNYMESPTAPDPWPGLDNVGYGRGQGIAGYGLGDDIVTRDHIGAVDPATGKALEWSPGSNSFEGNKAMLLTPRGLFAGGDAGVQGGASVGRVAFYDLKTIPAPGPDETTIINPIEGRVKQAGVPFVFDGTGTAPSGVSRVQIEIRDYDSGQYLQDDLVTWGAGNTINANLGSPGATSTTWTLPLTISGNHHFRIFAKTFGKDGSSDATKAAKKFETFGLTDQTPSTSITGPSGVVPTTTFTITGTAQDDFGVDSLIFSIRDSKYRYLQNDGTTDLSYNAFRGDPDVVGATAATWSWEVTVPYEDSWTFQATAVDTAGQSDLRSAAATWLVSSTAVAPSVAITTPGLMNPPTQAAAVVVAPGSPLTFTGSATDDQDLHEVDIKLSNSATHESLAADGTWGVDSVAAWHRISTPLELSGTSYNWSYTTPFNLSPGTYSFSVRAVDDLGLTTASANYGRLTINAQVPGDAFPDGQLNQTGTISGLQSLDLSIAGTATDDIGVSAVKVAIQDRATNRYLQANGQLSAAYSLLPAVLANPNTPSTTWTLAVTLPSQGDYNVTAFAYDTSLQQDPSTTGATARYPIFPGDTPPVQVANLFSPTEGTAFTDAKIFVSGRFEDDQQMAAVQVAIIDSAGRYMSSAGAFTSTAVQYRTAYLNSVGSPGSNFSYTTPAIPSGAYTVLAVGVDQHGLVTAVPVERHVTVTAPAGNTAPIARFTYSCNANVCAFDGRTSTDENAATLTYSWSFGQGTSSSTSPIPSRTYTAAGTYTVTLTVKDEYGLTGSLSQVLPAITTPANNQPPVPKINPPSCSQLVCNISSGGTVDPNVGDTITYLWNFNDGSPTSTSAAPSHSFPAAGTYNVTLTATDGWNAAATTSLPVTVSGTVVPPANAPPSAVFAAPVCNLLACTFTSTSSDTDGTIATTSWNFGDGTTGSGTPASHTYANPGTYGVVLTVTDDDGAVTNATRTLVVSVNAPPAASFTAPSCTLSPCSFTSTSTDDVGIATWAWNWGDGTADGTGASPSHTYLNPGTFTVTLTVTDTNGATNAVNHPVTVTGPANVPPVANYAAPNCTGLTCSFNGSTSSDPDGGGIVSYAWNFSDLPTATGVSTSHTFSHAGTFTVALTVTDNRGGTNVYSTSVTVSAPANVLPVAGFTAPTCTAGVACAFTSTSTDQDGTIATTTWDFSDLPTASGASTSHTFAAAGTYNVTLTVTDNSGGQGSVTKAVTVSPANLPPVGVRGQASSQGSSGKASVTIPASVVAGDQLVLVVTANAITTATTPAGWTLQSTVTDTDMQSWLFTRTATGPGGAAVSTTFGLAGATSTSLLVAYSGAAAPTVFASSTIDTTSSATLAAPSAAVPVNGSRVLRFWANKTATATGWTLPAGVTSRGSAAGSGSGHITAAAGDAAASAGASGTATATSDVAGAKGIAFTVVIRPA